MAGLYLSLVAAVARCSLIWSITRMTEAILGMSPREKKRVASLKIYDIARSAKPDNKNKITP
jgi:hypothetical protein